MASINPSPRQRLALRRKMVRTMDDAGAISDDGGAGGTRAVFTFGPDGRQRAMRRTTVRALVMFTVAGLAGGGTVLLTQTRPFGAADVAAWAICLSFLVWI
jgi:hypothetical protein